MITDDLIGQEGVIKGRKALCTVLKILFLETGCQTVMRTYMGKSV